MKAALIILAVAAAAISAYALIFLFSGLVETVNCEAGDADCISILEGNRESCTPSSTVIEGRDGIVMMVNISREGGRCVRTETVVNSTDPDSGYLLGHNVTCESELSRLGEPESLVCPGSLYDYVVPSGGGGGDTGGGFVPPPGIPELDCGIDDEECKVSADTYLKTCTNSKIMNTELRWEPNGFWTLFFNVSRQLEDCNYYVEVLNAVNLPPGMPASITGSNMTCIIPLSEMPAENLTAEWCQGDLFDYLYP